ncbi:MAG: RNA polymerase sigma-70 factor [Bacteroidetes bacterium]|nr:MAG: RNA polymerase sigma-70 factor [Bacteroidota bacterium]
MPLPDKEIIELYKQDPESGLKAVFDKYYVKLCVFAVSFAGDMETAEDIVQSLFVKFWEEKNLLEVKTSLSSYLFFSVRNACINYLVREKRNQQKMDAYQREKQFLLHTDEFPQDTHFETLEKHIEDLPERCRSVLELVFFHGHSYKQAAENLNISVNTVKTQLSRALTQLRKKIGILIIF